MLRAHAYAHATTQALAQATAGLTSGRDVTDILDRLVRDSAEVLGAQAAGLVVRVRGEDLELLNATSHQVAGLELFQVQQDASSWRARCGRVAVRSRGELAYGSWPGLADDRVVGRRLGG